MKQPRWGTRGIGLKVWQWLHRHTPWTERCWWTGHEWAKPLEVLDEQCYELDKATIVYRQCRNCGGAYAAERYPANQGAPAGMLERLGAVLDAAALPVHRRVFR